MIRAATPFFSDCAACWWSRRNRSGRRRNPYELFAARQCRDRVVPFSVGQSRTRRGARRAGLWRRLLPRFLSAGADARTGPGTPFGGSGATQESSLCSAGLCVCKGLRQSNARFLDSQRGVRMTRYTRLAPPCWAAGRRPPWGDWKRPKSSKAAAAPHTTAHIGPKQSDSRVAQQSREANAGV
jgi:hypothetical protein